MKKRAKLAGAPKYGLSPTVVHVAKAEKDNLDVGLSYLGVVEPFNRADVASRVAASVINVPVDEGDLVKKGGLLVELDEKDILKDIAALAAQVKQAKAELSANNATLAALEKSVDYWKREAQRDMTLARDGAIAESLAEATVNKADEIEGKRDAARRKSTALAEAVESLSRKKARAEAQLDYYRLRSPFDGIVTRRLVDPGDLASPGRALVTVEDRSRMMVVFDVPQQDLDRVREGLPVSFSIGDKPIKARISHIYPALSPSRMARAEVYIDGPDRKNMTIGAYVPATVRIAHLENVTLIPSDCMVNREDGKPYVYAVRDGHIHTMQVKELGNNGNMTAVSGISPGEQVVINTFLGWATLADGMPVEVAR